LKYSLVIPCFNEEKNLPLLIERCIKILDRNDTQLILVDNGSTDNTKKILSEYELQHKNLYVVYVKKNQGYGFGILSGLNEAQGDIIGWTHADMQTDPNDFITGVGFFKEFGSNIFVKGKRYGRPFSDTIFTVGMSIFESILLRKKLWDINAQPTIFSKSFFHSLKNPPSDFSLDLYFYYKAIRSNLKIYRFPVLFGKRMYGISSWNIGFKSKIKFIRRTINYSFKLKKYV
jgi:glycosyltransferase involved in cell wall biosynthesis